MKQNIQTLLSELNSLNNQIRGLQILFDNRKEILQKYFDKTGKQNVKTNDGTAYVQTRTSINYDIRKIKEALDEKVYRQFISKEYKLDLKTFSKICISNGIDRNLFKKAVIIEEKVDDKKLSAMYDKGEITLQDLDGCYDAKVSKTVAIKFFHGEPKLNVSE